MTANGIRQGYTGGLVLNQLHIGLAVGLVLIGCLTAFGGGVIVGMWYKASEQHGPLGAVASAPNPEPPAPGPEAAPPQPAPQASVTFYNTLTSSNVAYAPLTPPPAATPSTPGNGKGGAPSAPAAATPASSVRTDTASVAAGRGPVPGSPAEHARPMPSGATGDTKIDPVSTGKGTGPAAPPATTEVRAGAPGSTPEPAVATPEAKSTSVPPVLATAKPIPPPVRAVRSAAPSTASRPAKVTPAAKEVATHTPPAPTPVKATALTTPAAQKPVAVTRQAVAKETLAPRPASSAAESKTASATSRDGFSVQVGSFGSSEQAEKLRSNLSQKGYPARVQLSTVPGQGLRYRVRVGNYAERTAANQSAQHLTVQEQVPAIVAGKD